MDKQKVFPICQQYIAMGGSLAGFFRQLGKTNISMSSFRRHYKAWSKNPKGTKAGFKRYSGRIRDKHWMVAAGWMHAQPDIVTLKHIGQFIKRNFGIRPGKSTVKDALVRIGFPNLKDYYNYNKDLGEEDKKVLEPKFRVIVDACQREYENWQRDHYRIVSK